MFDLGRIVEHDVGLVRMQRRVVLMIGLGGIERLQRHDLGHDRPRKYFRLIKLSDVSLGDPFLLIVAVENGRPVLRAFVGALAIKLRGIVRDREKYAQQFAVSNLRGVVNDLHRLGVSGFAGADGFVLGGFGRAAGVAGGRADDSLYMLEDRLNAPETSARNDGGLLSCERGARSIDRGGGHGGRGLARALQAVAPRSEAKRSRARRLRDCISFPLLRYEIYGLPDWSCRRRKSFKGNGRRNPPGRAVPPAATADTSCLLFRLMFANNTGMAITRRQREVYDFISRFVAEHQYSPSFEEIGKGLELTSLATVHKHVTNLEKKGLLTRDYNRSRSIDLLPPKGRLKQAMSVNTGLVLPLLGRIAAGQPIEAVQNNETISLADFVRSKEVFVLEVRGDSMQDEAILNGDYVLVEKARTAHNGDIVVALVDQSDATLKRFYLEGDKIRLQPSNATMKPIIVPAASVDVQGRVIGVLRKY